MNSSLYTLNSELSGTSAQPSADDLMAVANKLNELIQALRR